MSTVILSPLDTMLLYFLAAIVFAGVDFIWLAKVAPALYKRDIGHLMAAKPNVWAAFAFYALYLAGLLVFVLVPALNRSEPGYALLYGGLFGLFTYGTFDLTGMAVLKRWPLRITVIDMCWGVVLCSAVSVISYAVARELLL